MIKFDEKSVFARCSNPDGFFGLPVGQVFLVNKGDYHNVAFSDFVDGALLNDILKHNPREFDKIVFRYPNGQEEVIYEKD